MVTLQQRWSNYWTGSWPVLFFRLLMLIEIAWIIVVCVFIPWYQVSQGIGLEELRIELILFAFHITAIMSVIGLLESHAEIWPFVIVFWLIFTVFTDLWSVLQVWLHTASVPSVDQTFLNGIKSMSIIGICISGLTVIAYTIVLIKQSVENVKNDKLVKDMKRLVETDSKINHKYLV